MLFRQIEYLHAIMKYGNFYEAADALSVSQPAISQQIKKLEDELGVKLLERHNRTFSLTPAGEHFYHKTLILESEIEQIIRETKKIDNKEMATLRLGYYIGYHGSEFSEAVGILSEKYPTLDIQIMSGSHEDLYHALISDEVDLVLNDQRRAFSGAYHNLVLSESEIHIEISARSALCNLETVDVTDLSNLSCILVASGEQQKEEQTYYHEIIGLKGSFVFSSSLQDARLKIITGQGFMPVDVLPNETYIDTAVKRIPLTRSKDILKKTYCAFWSKENSGYYVEEFAGILKSLF